MAANERIVISNLKPETTKVLHALEVEVQKNPESDDAKNILNNIKRLAGTWDGQGYQNPEGYGHVPGANRQMEFIVGALRNDRRAWKPLREAIDSTGLPQAELTAAADDIRRQFHAQGINGSARRGRW